MPAKAFIVKALDELPGGRTIKPSNPIRRLLGSTIGKTFAVTLSALLLLSFIVLAAPAQQTADHVVISEIQVADNEFVELYNPTDEDIDMTGWHWCYFSSTKTSWSMTFTTSNTNRFIWTSSSSSRPSATCSRSEDVSEALSSKLRAKKTKPVENRLSNLRERTSNKGQSSG